MTTVTPIDRLVDWIVWLPASAAGAILLLLALVLTRHLVVAMMCYQVVSAYFAIRCVRYVWLRDFSRERQRDERARTARATFTRARSP